MSTDLFSSQADLYARFRPQYPKEIYEFLVGHCGANDLAWDCATGNGQAAVDLAKFFKRVIATDLSERQLANAAKADNIDYRILRAEERLDVEDHSVDLITVAQALHWFELDKFYEEVNRLLKPGGLFATWAYSFHKPIGPTIDGLLNDFYFTTLGPFWKNHSGVLWDDYKNLSFPFSEIATPKLELSVHWSLDDLIGFFKTWSSTQLFIEKNRSDPTLKLRELLLPHWGKSGDMKQLKWKLVFRAGRIR